MRKLCFVLCLCSPCPHQPQPNKVFHCRPSADRSPRSGSAPRRGNSRAYQHGNAGKCRRGKGSRCRHGSNPTWCEPSSATITGDRDAVRRRKSFTCCSRIRWNIAAAGGDRRTASHAHRRSGSAGAASGRRTAATAQGTRATVRANRRSNAVRDSRVLRRQRASRGCEAARELRSVEAHDVHPVAIEVGNYALHDRSSCPHAHDGCGGGAAPAWRSPGA